MQSFLIFCRNFQLFFLKLFFPVFWTSFWCKGPFSSPLSLSLSLPPGCAACSNFFCFQAAFSGFMAHLCRAACCDSSGCEKGEEKKNKTQSEVGFVLDFEKYEVKCVVEAALGATPLHALQRMCGIAEEPKSTCTDLKKPRLVSGRGWT